MNELVPGGNMPLPGGPLALRVPGPFDVSALITDDGGTVRGDGDFVFYNQPDAPGARLRGETLTVDPRTPRPGASRVTVVDSPADPGTHVGGLPWLTNAERTAAGLRPLAGDPLLTAAAQAHSADMVTRAFSSPTGPDGSEPWHRAAAAGSTRRTIGENIACGRRSAAEVVRGWMNSPGHRANILKPGFTHLGTGFAGGGTAGTYWTQLFGG
ncbi:CAP domain-containing protein [Streptomyces avermitilis]|uniref:CAP domain-containing protein n=1 Tax=Streptomyces avermitilis TaxID=33903 RepID=UPI003411999F